MSTVNTIQHSTAIRNGGDQPRTRQPYVNSFVLKKNWRRYSGTQNRNRLRVPHASYGRRIRGWVSHTVKEVEYIERSLGCEYMRLI